MSRSGPPIVAMMNQKGGVGKTSMTLGLGYAAVRDGWRVLVCDCDPQANSTEVLVPVDQRTTDGIYLVAADTRDTRDATLADVIQSARPEWAGVDVAPGSIAMAEVDADVSVKQPMRLRKALADAADVLAKYDVVFIDCPPSIGRVWVGAVLASTHAVLVTEPGLFAAAGLGQINDSLAELAEAFPGQVPELSAVIINKFKAMTREAGFREAEVREAFGDLVLQGAVPELAAIPDAWSAGVPVQSLTKENAKAVTHVLDRMWFQLTAKIGVSK